MLKRTHLRHFIALAETGGFTAAARRLNLTQPTLSASAAELERLVGTPLVLRAGEGGRRTIRLTDADHRLLTLAHTIERDFHTAETLLVAGRAELRPLQLGILTSLSTTMVADIRGRFGNERPLVLIEGADADLRRRMAAGHIDAAITLMRAGEHSETVLEEGYAVLMSGEHRLAGRAEVEVDELARETMIARRSCEILAETSKFFRARGVRPHFLIRSANDDRCLQLVGEGLGSPLGQPRLPETGSAPCRWPAIPSDAALACW